MKAMVRQSKSVLSITAQITIKTPITRVWSVLLDPPQWWDGVTLEAQVGGTFKEQWDENITSGKVLEWRPNRTLVLSWKDTDWPGYTRVSILLSSKNSSTTTVSLAHEGWDIFEKEHRKSLISAHRMGWKAHLNALKVACEARGEEKFADN